LEWADMEQKILSAIAAQLKEIVEQSKVTDAKIASFCQELGIKPPF